MNILPNNCKKGDIFVKEGGDKMEVILVDFIQTLDVWLTGTGIL